MNAKQADGAAVRDVQASLERARDVQISRVVAVVDAMPLRGAADDLIAPLRPRLAQIRPVRPFSFRRLLFTPLDPVIVPPGKWRSGDAGIPRTALPPLAAAIRAAIPRLDAELDGAFDAPLSGASPNDRSAILAAGSLLWPVAAQALDALQSPVRWLDAPGLPAAEIAALAGAAAAVLRQASTIEQAVCQRRMPKDEVVRDMLASAEACGAAALGTMVAVLVARLPSPGRVLALASEAASGPRHRAADAALDHTLATLEDTLVQDGNEPQDIAHAAQETARIAALLAGLDESAGSRPDRRRQIESIRRSADVQCRRRFEAGLAEAFGQAEGTLTACDDQMVESLETSARDLRKLEGAGRQFGGGAHFDALLQRAAVAFRDGPSGLELADKVRLVEILAGSDEALAMLTSAAPNG